MTEKKKILIIDDMESVRSMLIESLKEDYDVLEAYDGLSGMGLILDERPDLIVCDLLMPTVTGGELIAELKDNPEINQTPLIVITASAYVSAAAIHVKESDIVKKPFNIDQLREKIEEKLSISA